MLHDPYAVLRALLRAEAARSAPKADRRTRPHEPPRPPEERDRG
ncbi:hypothetical protein [Streptomyces sp. NPDC057382]